VLWIACQHQPIFGCHPGILQLPEI
jgi:hypothetical protein